MIEFSEEQQKMFAINAVGEPTDKKKFEHALKTFKAAKAAKAKVQSAKADSEEASSINV